MTITETTRTEYERSVEERLSKAGATIDRILRVAARLSGGLQDAVHVMAEDLRADRQLVVDRLQELREADSAAWERYRTDVTKAVERMDSEVEIAERQLEIHLADSREEFVGIVDRLLEDWRSRIEEFRVKAELGKMEVRDELSPIIETVETKRRAAVRALEELERAPEESWEALRGGVRGALDALRDAYREARERT